MTRSFGYSDPFARRFNNAPINIDLWTEYTKGKVFSARPSTDPETENEKKFNKELNEESNHSVDSAPSWVKFDEDLKKIRITWVNFIKKMAK